MAGALKFQACPGPLYLTSVLRNTFLCVSTSFTLNQNKTKSQKNMIFCCVAEIDQSYLLTKEISNDLL